MSDALIPWLPLAPLGAGALGLLRAFFGARLVAGIGRRISTRRAKRRGEGVARVKGRVVRLDGQPEGVVDDGPCALVRFSLKRGPSTLVAYDEQGPLRLSDKRGLVELHWGRRHVLIEKGLVTAGGLDDPPPGLVRTLYQRFDYDAPSVKEGRGFHFREVAVRPGNKVEAVGALRQRDGKLVLTAGRFPLVLGAEGAGLLGPLWRKLAVETALALVLVAVGVAWAVSAGTWVAVLNGAVSLLEGAT